MNQCLSETQIRQYIALEVGPEELVRLNRHVCECGSCKAKVLAGTSIVSGAARVMLPLVPKMTECPLSDELARFVDGELSARKDAAVACHLGVCAPCARTVRDLQHLAALASHVGVGRERASFSIWRIGMPAALAACGVLLVAVALNITNQPPSQVAQDRSDMASAPGLYPDEHMYRALEQVPKKGAAEPETEAATRVALVVPSDDRHPALTEEVEEQIRGVEGLSFTGRTETSRPFDLSMVARDTEDVADYAVVIQPPRDGNETTVSILNTKTGEKLWAQEAPGRPASTYALARNSVLRALARSVTLATGVMFAPVRQPRAQPIPPAAKLRPPVGFDYEAYRDYAPASSRMEQSPAVKPPPMADDPTPGSSDNPRQGRKAGPKGGPPNPGEKSSPGKWASPPEPHAAPPPPPDQPEENKPGGDPPQAESE